MVSTSEAEAANHPTQATKSPAVQSGLAAFFSSSPHHFYFISHFVSVILVFTTTLCLQGSAHQGMKLLHGATHAFAVDAASD